MIERVTELTAKYEVNRVPIALAWLVQKENLAAPIVGATKISLVKTAVEDVFYLEEDYVPHKIVASS